MKHRIAPLFLAVFLCLLSLGWRHSAPESGQLYRPVSMTLDGNRLLVSDSYTGLHVYDVTNLGAPRKLQTIPFEYNVSSAVKNDIIYTNDSSQLVALRLTEDSYTVVARLGTKRYFDPDVNPPYDDEYSYFACVCANTFDSDTAPTSPTGSSYATFAVVDDVLYRVDNSSLLTYDISTPDKPSRFAKIDVGWDIETLHPSPNLLFIGGFNGMYIFDREDPLHPKQLSKIEHARACDPVVASGSTAFVTLRGGNRCGMSDNELLCVNIKDPHAPAVIGQMELTTPYGLAVDNARLYVSHGGNGYSLISVSNPNQPAIEKTWPGESTRDFIWSGNTLFVLSEDNVTIYDVTEPLTPKVLSRVESGSSL